MKKLILRLLACATVITATGIGVAQLDANANTAPPATAQTVLSALDTSLAPPAIPIAQFVEHGALIQGVASGGTVNSVASIVNVAGSAGNGQLEKVKANEHGASQFNSGQNATIGTANAPNETTGAIQITATTKATGIGNGGSNLILPSNATVQNANSAINTATANNAPNLNDNATYTANIARQNQTSTLTANANVNGTAADNTTTATGDFSDNRTINRAKQITFNEATNANALTG